LSSGDLTKLKDKQSQVRIEAFNNLADKVSRDLAPQHAQPIARYLLVTIEQKSELEAVTGKLTSFARCHHLLLALADLATNDSVAQERIEAVAGVVLGQPLRLARDEDWRSACRKLLLQRALDLLAVSTKGPDKAADVLRDLYKEQGLAFGLEDPEFEAQTRPTGVLEGLIKHVAANAANKDSTPQEKEYLEQIDRRLQAVRFVAENDLEHMVLLQRVWLEVLILYLQERAPAQTRGMRQIQQDLADHDRTSRNVLDQLRAGEEKILRVWKLAHKLK
jgi:hypothetical protein